MIITTKFEVKSLTVRVYLLKLKNHAVVNEKFDKLQYQSKLK